MGKTQKIKIAFGKILRERRHEAGISQEQLALNCGLDRTYISLLERGLRQPSLNSLFLLAEALGTTPSVMLSLFERKFFSKKR